MLYKLSSIQENELLAQPETGMGYQVVEASKQGHYSRERFLVLNSEIVVEMNDALDANIRKVVNEGIYIFKLKADIITLSAVSVLDEKEFRKILHESKSEKERGAVENSVVNADGDEVFVRLSAFENDRRIDKVNMCLRAGSYTTTWEDYLRCKSSVDEPVERYALPTNDKIQFAFYVQPLKSDTLQRGIVQPAFGKRGGGKEAYFDKGTAIGTYKKQTSY